MSHVSLRLELNGELADKFFQIKTQLGLQHNTEVIRQLIKTHPLESQRR